MKRPGELAACLLALQSGEDSTEAEAGAYVLADTIRLVRGYLTGGKG